MREQELFPGDVLALYTDGVTEASNDRGEEFGERLFD
jgi:serine phosphatase RsbU (regulator of sigma subunit)